MYKITTSLPGLNLLWENNHKNECIYIDEMDDESLGTRKQITVTLTSRSNMRIQNLAFTINIIGKFFYEI